MTMRGAFCDLLRPSYHCPCVRPAAGVAQKRAGSILAQAQSSRRPGRQDLDWEPDLLRKTPLLSPGSSKPSGMPPPPPPPPPLRRREVSWYEQPFASRRNIALTMLGGTAALYLFNHKGVINFQDKPDIPFNLAGFTDVDPAEFVYFKTPGGNWVAAAHDEEGRLYMIDQIGDLYYDSGDPDVGLYVMDTGGNLFNDFQGDNGERKIVPVGNVSDLKQFKISNIAGVKLENDVGIVAFQDGSSAALPPGKKKSDYMNSREAPKEIMEGFDYDDSSDGSLLGGAFGTLSSLAASSDRVELDLTDATPFTRQIYDQTFLYDAGMDGYGLPDDFDIEALAAEVVEEAKAAGR